MCRTLCRRDHSIRINPERYELATRLRKQFAGCLEILGGLNGEDISLTQQVTVKPALWRRKAVPPIEEPHGLCDKPRSAMAAPGLP